MMEVAVGVAPSPPAVGLPAAPSGSGCWSGAPAPLGEPRRAMTSPRGLRPGLSLTFSDRAPGLPSTQSQLPWRARVAPGPPTWNPPAAPSPPPRRPPHGRIRQDVSPPRPREQRDQARRRTRSQEASHLPPARARSSSGSYERRRPASAARQGCSRGRSSGRRRAATVASASERGSSGGRAGRPRPVEAPSRREGAHPPSVPEAGGSGPRSACFATRRQRTSGCCCRRSCRHCRPSSSGLRWSSSWRSGSVGKGGEDGDVLSVPLYLQRRLPAGRTCGHSTS